MPDVDLSFLWRDIKSSGVTKEEEDKEKEEEEIDKDKLREAIEDLLTPPPQLLEPKLDENRWQILVSSYNIYCYHIHVPTYSQYRIHVLK